MTDSKKLKANFHLTIPMSGQRAKGKIQRNSYHHGSCGPSLKGKTLSVDDTNLILGGDFNSRTSDIDDYIILDNPDFIPELSESANYESDSFNIPRNSKDKELNNYGRELVSFCRSYGMHMLNGRKEGDREGNFTCIAKGGRSTVD